MRSLLSAALLAFATAAQAALPYTETLVHAPVDASGHRVLIDVTVFRPPGAGPFPVVVLSHGSPRTPQARRTDGRQRLTTQALPFLSMGFAVIVPTRRGYGESGGEWAEGYGPCANPDYYTAGLETARDVRAAVDAIRGESWVDAKHIVLAGQSAGGFGSVAASAMPFDGLVGVINFAGGRGSLAPQRVCEESRLVEAMARYGAKVHVPSLWLYSANDQYFGPDLARRMYQAFVQAGGNAEFIEAPPTGLDGHSYFARATEDWAPRVMKFLQRIGVKR
jgi:dipeptidyl aminopeptidase/acylaminoacyl peptidase